MRRSEAVLDERSKHPGATLADLYDPFSMPPALRAKHAALDVEVDALYGLRRPTEAQRMTAIVRVYTELASPLFATTGRGRRPRSRHAPFGE